jgi:hypothetical protein
MPEIAVEIELYCARCGEGICANGTATRKRNQECFVIEPCETCLSRASDKGFEEGHQKGYADAEDAAQVRP